MALDRNYKDGLWYYSNQQLTPYEEFRGQGSNLPTWADYAPMLTQENQDFLRSKGFSGALPMAGGGEYSPVDAFDEISNWANQNGIVIGRSEPRDWGNGGSNYMWSMFDQNTGQPVGTPNAVGNTDTMIGLLSPVLMAAAGPLAAAYGGGIAGGAAAGATLGGASGGVGAFEKGGNILEGAGKGALIGGATGAAGGAFGTGSGQFNVGEALNLSDPSLIKFANQAATTLGKSAITGKNPMQSLLSSGINAGMGLLGSGSDAGGGGGFDEGNIQVDGGGSGVDDIDWSNWAQNELDNGLFSGGTMSDFDLNSLLNGGQIDWSKWADGEVGGTLPRTPATDAQVGNMLNGGGLSGLGGLIGAIAKPIGSALGGAPSAVGGGSNLAALIGAGLGAIGGNKGQAQTTQQQIDPRMAQYLYGTGAGDTNSLFGAAQKQWQDNKSGINPTMQQGLDMQLKALNDPAYGQAYTGMRTQGMGLMNAPIASNPFTSGSNQGLLPAGGDRIQNLMARGRGLLSA